MTGSPQQTHSANFTRRADARATPGRNAVDEKLPNAFTIDHFRAYAQIMVWDDDEQRDLEDTDPRNG